jgi:hypothetical protein
LGANLLEFTSDAYDTVLYDGEGQRVKLPGYRVDALTDAAIVGEPGRSAAHAARRGRLAGAA